MDPSTPERPDHLSLRGRRVGAGRPLVAVPLMGRTADDLERLARQVDDHPVGLAEWRLDHLEAGAGSTSMDARRVRAAADRLTTVLGDLPVLVTYRTRGQGGEGDAPPGAVLHLIEALADHPGLDLFDVEADHPHRDEALAVLRAAGCPSLLSHHDWAGQRDATGLAAQVRGLREVGADAVKLATTPGDTRAAIDLLHVLAELAPAGAPLAMLGMGDAGRVTRVAGPACGSFLTFAHLGELSAPGQMPVDLVAATVDALLEAAGPPADTTP